MANEYPLGDLMIKDGNKLAMRTQDDGLIFLKSTDPKPTAREGTMLYILDTGDVFVPYKGTWEVL